MVVAVKTSAVLFLTILCSTLISTSAGEDYLKQWCIADEQAPENVLQMALDWACGKGGADCSMIQEHKPCFLPNTVKDHASFAFNSYWQKTKNIGGSCYFSSAALVSDLDPSHGSCKYESHP